MTTKKTQESAFARATRRKMEKKAEDQATISKVLKKFEAAWGEPVAEITEAQEDGILIGKRNERLNNQEDFTKKVEALKYKVMKELEEVVEADVEKRVEACMARKGADKETAKSLTKTLLEMQEGEGGIGIVLTANFKKEVGEGIVAACGSVKDHVKMFRVASEAHEAMKVAILIAAKEIAEAHESEKPMCSHCGCRHD